MATGQWFASESGGQGIWALSESAATAPVITAVDPVSGTELQVTWTGTASRYRLDGGTPVTLTDTVSPATISGLSPNTLYAVELDNGDGNWSNSVSEWTDNTGGGGGGLFEAADATHAHTADNLVLTLGYTLAVQDATHAHAADNVDLSLIPPLEPDDATHAHAADALALSTASILTIADAYHSHGADKVNLSRPGQDDELAGSPPGLNFDADEDEYIEDMQMLMAIAAAAFELEMV